MILNLLSCYANFASKDKKLEIKIKFIINMTFTILNFLLY